MALICVAETYVSGAGMPSNSTRMPPSDVATVFEDVRVKLNALAGPGLMPKILTISPGATAPGMPLAAFTTPLTVGPGPVPTVSITGTLIGPIPLSAGVRVTVPLYVPRVRPVVFTDTVMAVGIEAGWFTNSQFPPARVMLEAVSGNGAPPLKNRLIVWGSSATPGPEALKASDLGSTKNDGLVTNRVIGITMEAAFDAETVIVPLNVPGDRADAFTVTVRIAWL